MLYREQIHYWEWEGGGKKRERRKREWASEVKEIKLLKERKEDHAWKLWGSDLQVTRGKAKQHVIDGQWH